jgi:hypothetical protein
VRTTVKAIGTEVVVTMRDGDFDFDAIYPPQVASSIASLLMEAACKAEDNVNRAKVPEPPAKSPADEDDPNWDPFAE